MPDKAIDPPAEQGRAVRTVIPGPDSTAMALDAMLGRRRLAGNSAIASVLQRQTPAPAPPVTPPSATPAPPLRRLPRSEYVLAGPRFDMNYNPGEPLPAIGAATVTLKVHVKFKDFDESMMRRKDLVKHKWTKEQLSQFAWPPDKKAGWVAKFAQVVSDGWKEKFAFTLTAPGMERYRASCGVRVQHVDDPADANTVIVAQWVPPGAPRLRSSVSGSRETAELDARDTEEPTTATVMPYTLVRQIGPFGFDSHDIAGVEGPVRDFVALVRKQREPGGKLAGPKDELALGCTGRASSPGPKKYNEKLAGKRADAVMDRVSSETGLDAGIVLLAGEHNATADPAFQRVDMVVHKGTSKDVSQVTAVHEAGHMFGLGDEYVDESPSEKRFAPMFEGDKPTHHADVKNTMGDEAADDLINRQSDSIMSKGSVVKPGHYVYFLRAMNDMTSQTWAVE